MAHRWWTHCAHLTHLGLSTPLATPAEVYARGVPLLPPNIRTITLCQAHHRYLREVQRSALAVEEGEGEGEGGSPPKQQQEEQRQSLERLLGGRAKLHLVRSIHKLITLEDSVYTD